MSPSNSKDTVTGVEKTDGIAVDVGLDGGFGAAMSGLLLVSRERALLPAGRRASRRLDDSRGEKGIGR